MTKVMVALPAASMLSVAVKVIPLITLVSVQSYGAWSITLLPLQLPSC